MTRDLWIIIGQNLEMGFVFLIPFLLCRTADILFGIITVLKMESLKFDKNKLGRGIVATAMSLIALACLIAGVTMIPELLGYYGINVVDTDALGNIVNVITILSTIVISTFSYGKDAYEKLKIILHTPTHPEDL